MPDGGLFVPVGRVHFWALSTVVGLVILYVRRVSSRSRQLEADKEAATNDKWSAAIAGLEASFNGLSDAIREHAKKTERLFDKGEARMDKLDGRVTWLEAETFARDGKIRGER